MAETTKTKVLNIQTTGAEKNVKTLKQQIKELKEELAGLEKGTEEYNRVAKQLADTNQKNIEISEAMKYNNKDFGATISNLTKVTAGVVGAINSVNAVMVMMGADSEEAQEALKNVQMTMAVIQGMGAVDTALKAFDGLLNAFGLTKTEVAAETAEIEKNTAEKLKNAGASNAMATADKQIGNTNGQTEKMGQGFKGILKTLKALPSPLKVILGAVTAIVAVVKVIDTIVKKTNEERRKAQEFENEINMEVQRQSADVETLVAMFKEGNNTEEQRKALAKEINKLAGDELVTRNETNGELEISNEKLEQYNKNLRTQIELEAYKKKLVELINEQEDLEAQKIKEQNAWIGKPFTTVKGLTKDINANLKEQEKLMQKITDLSGDYADNLAQADKAANKTKKTGGGVVKTFKEILKDLKEIYKQAVENLYDERLFRMVYNGIYTETKTLLDDVNRIVEEYNLGEKVTDIFKEQLANGFEGLRPADITADRIFGKDALNKLAEELIEERQKLDALQKKGKKVTDKEVQAQKEIVELQQKRIAQMNELAEAVVKYTQAVVDQNESMRQVRKDEENNAASIQSMKDYLDELVTVPETANISKTIRDLTLEFADLNETIIREQVEMKRLLNSPDQNKEWEERRRELSQQLADDLRKAADLELQLQEQRISYRQAVLEKMYAEIDKKERERSLTPYKDWLGLKHYDESAVTQLKSQLQTIQDKIKATKWLYDEQLMNLEEGTEEYKRVEKEKQEALKKLEEEGALKRLEIQKAEYEQKIANAKNYVSVYQTISSQVSSLLSAEMEQYDENSAKYKKLKYAQGVTDTLSGTLAAFMSGVESGLKPPFNIILGGVLSAITFAAGLAQLQNIKKGTLTNAATASPVNIGDYDTLSYKNSVDILSAIKDQKVYVTESDITTTQNRVRVMENQSTF